MRRWRLDVSFWNVWTSPRVERPADGSVSLYWGFGKFSWKIDSKPVRRPEVEADEHH